MAESEFDNISPYTDEEAVEALGKVANHPAILAVSKYLFPDKPVTFLRSALKSLHSIDEFQQVVMSKVIDWVLNNTAKNFSYDGISNLQGINGKFLTMSNHRDIILDPAITQYVLHQNGFPMSEICVGDNLISSSKTVEYLLRSNRMIKVIRGISARELYLSSQVLSKYIRQTITSGKSSVWIAQKQGRTKNGIDTTEQGLLKMLDMSGTGTFCENFEALNIIPLSISYEYEPCDIKKARELFISRTQKYVKGPKEDLHSILMCIRQRKGNIHLNFGAPLTHEEILEASYCDKNDRYQAIRHAVDKRVIEGYRLWKTNYIAYDMMNQTNKYAEFYTPEDVQEFNEYTEHRLKSLERSLDREEIRKIFISIYGNPVAEKEKLAAEQQAIQEAKQEKENLKILKNHLKNKELNANINVERKSKALN
ncbi:MAG: acyltransferase [Bacteroidales bacterium]|nr:acyltransferase [Bacteroidales bacterium]